MNKVRHVHNMYYVRTNIFIEGWYKLNKLNNLDRIQTIYTL